MGLAGSERVPTCNVTTGRSVSISSSSWMSESESENKSETESDSTNSQSLMSSHWGLAEWTSSADSALSRPISPWVVGSKVGSNRAPRDIGPAHFAKTVRRKWNIMTINDGEMVWKPNIEPKRCTTMPNQCRQAMSSFQIIWLLTAWTICAISVGLSVQSSANFIRWISYTLHAWNSNEAVEELTHQNHSISISNITKVFQWTHNHKPCTVQDTLTYSYTFSLPVFMGHGHGVMDHEMSSWTMTDRRKHDAQSSTVIAPTSALSPWGWTRWWTPACHSPRQHPCHLPCTGKQKLAGSLSQPAKSSHSCSQSLKGPLWQ